MLFTNKRQYLSTSQNKTQQTTIPNSMIFVNRFAPNRVVSPPFINRTVTQIAKTVEPSEKIENTKSYWGKPTWVLFHTMAEKIKDEYFPKVKSELFNMIQIICIHLPCPICANHAKKYIESININAIHTKDELKNMLFEFHNAVNVRNDYPLFKKEDLDVTYSNVSLGYAVQQFTYHFKDKTRNLKMISSEMYRNIVIKQVNTFFAKNGPFFFA